jgi:hypothetical protein
MKKPAQHLIAEVPCRHAKVEMTIGIDLGHIWSHYCTLNQDGDVVGRGRFRTTPKAIEKWFTGLPPARIAMEAGEPTRLDQRATAGVGTRSHRGQRAGVAGDLA